MPTDSLDWGLLVEEELFLYDAATLAPDPPVQGASWLTMQRPVFATELKMVSLLHT